MLKLEALSFQSHGRSLLSGVTAAIPGSALTCLIGANGAGKTTLLRILAGELRPGSGRFVIDGTPSTSLTEQQIARRFSIIPQDVPPPAYLTVAELATLARFHPRSGLWWRPGDRDRAIIKSCLNVCQMDALSQRRMDQLSGGEQQRAWLAFGLAQEKPYLLLDETLGGLDILARKSFFGLLKGIASQAKGVVLTTHDLELVSDFADWTVVLRAGRVTYEGPPSDRLLDFLAQAL
ncbi:MAG: ABC transporter ATP-binding protein [Chloroflexi bacterium]|nr:ABC transporter ATP-binding protein [Chloroflexota bacterium]